MPRTGVPAGTAGAGGEKTARSKGAIVPLRTGLAENNPHPAAHQTAGQVVGCSLRFMDVHNNGCSDLCAGRKRWLVLKACLGAVVCVQISSQLLVLNMS